MSQSHTAGRTSTSHPRGSDRTSRGRALGGLGRAGRHVQVVVIGGGFAGLAAVRELRDPRFRVTLVDPAGAQVFQPLLFQVATGILEPDDITRAHADTLRRRHNAVPMQATVVGFDPLRRRVRLRMAEGTPGVLPYDVLVVAAGLRHSFGPRPEWQAYARGLSSLDDAMALRHDLLTGVGGPGTSTVVVGGGPTGVELAGRAAEMTRAAGGTVTLVEAGRDVLATYPPLLRGVARRELQRAGVDVRTSSPVLHIDDGAVVVPDGAVAADTVIWAGGAVATPVVGVLAESFGADVDAAGRVAVMPDLSLPGHPEVFVVGDAASVPGVPTVAAAAMQMGRHAARVAAARKPGRSESSRRSGLAGRWPGRQRRFRYLDKGSMAVVNRRSAVAMLGPGLLPLWGPPAMALWLGVHLWYLPGLPNRVSTAAHWAARLTRPGRAVPGATPRS